MTHETGEGNTEGHEESEVMRETPAEKIRRERKTRFLELLPEEGHITATAARLGVSPSTVYRWRVLDPAFNDAVADWLTEEMEEVVATNMFRIATSQDSKIANASVKAGEFMLKSLNREKYGDQLKTEGTINISGQIDIAHQVQQQFRVEHAQLRDKARALRTIDAEGGQK